MAMKTAVELLQIPFYKKDLGQRSKVVGIFKNQESCLRYVCMKLMKIDE
jgi:transposase-like protein